MMIHRATTMAALRRNLAHAPAVALLGPRQVGKTTLARLVAHEFPGSLYLDLESTPDLRKLDDAHAYLNDQAGRLTVIDEIQRAPQLFAELRGLIDKRRAAGERYGQFLLLGSASLDLVQQASETLAGRITYLDMGPIMPWEATAAGIGLDQLWLRGGFPDSLTAGSEEASYLWRQAFIRSYLERDVPMFAPRMPAATVGRLWSMLANAQGSMLNAARLAQGLGVSSPAVMRYIDLLADLMLVRRLQPWSGNLGKRLVRSPKVYVRDSGLVHALLEIGTHDHLLGHPVVGPSWEGFVVEALITAAGPSVIPMFYRTADGAELDLVFERAGKAQVGIEIKRSSAPKIEKGFTVACEDLGLEHRLIVSAGQGSYQARDGVTVHGLASAVDAVGHLTKSLFA
jgi:predicted AAA+ superfamily ATPase